MSVFEKIHIPSNYFSYQRGKIITEIPWGRPTYSKIKEFLLEIQNTSDIMKDYDLYLVGGVLWDFNKTWDVDIVMVGNCDSYIVLEDYMHYMYDIAFKSHKLLLDVSWVNDKPSDTINAPEFYPVEDIEYLTIGYIRKQIKDEISENNLLDNPNYTPYGDYLVKGNYKNSIQTVNKNNDRIKQSLKSTVVRLFSVKDFLEKDEEYFLKNTNRS